MSPNTSSQLIQKTRTTGSLIGIVASLLLIAGLVALVRSYTQVPVVDQARIDLRRKSLAEINAASTTALTTAGWQDQAKGIVRLPIDRAMELVVQEWKDPAAGRSNLILRAERANAPTGPTPDQKVVYE